MNFTQIQGMASSLHAKAAQTKPRQIKVKGITWQIAWDAHHGNFRCTNQQSEESINYNTRSQSQAVKWLREYLVS